MTFPKSFSVAPMMNCTDRHARYFMRLISHNTILYSEMITTSAILHGDRQKYLSYNTIEHPIVLQIGGSNPNDFAKSCDIVNNYGYDAININCGCPSKRVQKAEFGISMMKNPKLVAQCIQLMIKNTNIPISVKNRIGIDNHASYDNLKKFTEIVANAGCRKFIVHARKAYLNGISPKENRCIPPLQYDFVYKLKEDFKELEIIINGGITSLDESKKHLQYVDGVMIGREVYSNPYILATVDNDFYDDKRDIKSRYDIIKLMIPYLKKNIRYEKNQQKITHITRHMLGLFYNQIGAKKWRKYLMNTSAEQVMNDFQDIYTKLLII